MTVYNSLWLCPSINAPSSSLPKKKGKIKNRKRLSMVCIILYTISQCSDMVEGHTGRGRIWTVMRGDGRRLLPFRFEESQLRWRWNVHRQSQQLPRQPESLLHRSRKLSSRSSFSYSLIFLSSSLLFLSFPCILWTGQGNGQFFRVGFQGLGNDATFRCLVRLPSQEIQQR